MRHALFVGLFVALCLGSLSASLSAQYPVSANALSWTGETSAAGPFCWGFSCTLEAATITSGEVGEIMVRGEFRQPYILLFSLSATRCLSSPEWFNSLVLDDPIHVLHVGVVTDQSGILSCPSSTDTLHLTVPAGVPPGVSISLQGIVGVPGPFGFPEFSFTQALTFTTV